MKVLLTLAGIIIVICMIIGYINGYDFKSYGNEK